jgi:hypothetical protein
VVSALFVCGPILADLQHELAVGRELEDLAVVVAVAGDPDEALRVDVDAVLVARPVVARAGGRPTSAAPCLRR